MKHCNLCGTSHDGQCDFSKFDPILSKRFGSRIPETGIDGGPTKEENKKILMNKQDNVECKPRRGRPKKHG